MNLWHFGSWMNLGICGRHIIFRRFNSGSPPVEGILPQSKPVQKLEWHHAARFLMKSEPSRNIALENHGINITILDTAESW